MRFSTYSFSGEIYYGAVSDDGLIPLSPHFETWPTLLEAIRDDGLTTLSEPKQKRSMPFIETCVLTSPSHRRRRSFVSA